MPALQRTDLIGAEPVWLLTLTWGSRDIRLSTLPVSMTDDDGDSYRYDGGLPEPSYEDSIELMSSDLQIRSVPIEVILPGVDVAQEVARGHDLSAATGELSLWLPGTSYDDRRVLIQGIISQPQYGAAGETVSFALAELPWDDTSTICSGVLQRDTWEPLIGTGSTYTPAENSEGSGYPLVFGAPGQYGPNTQDRVPGSAAPISDINLGATSPATAYCIIAGHPVVTQTGLLYSASLGSYTQFSSTDVVEVSSPEGLMLTVLDMTTGTFSTATRQAYTDGYYIVWSSGGAARNPYGSGVLEGAGDLIRYLLSLSSVRVDDGRCAAAAAKINSYILAGYIDQADVSPYQWIADNLVPILPISLHTGPDGLYPVVWRYDATSQDAADHLEAGAGITRIGPVEYVRKPSEIRNEITVEWGLDAQSGDYSRSTRVSTIARGASQENLYSRASQARYGVRPYTIQTDVVYDEQTAQSIALWMLRAYGFALRSIRYEVDLDRGWWSPGDVVTLTDSELYLESQVCLVQSVQWGGPSLIITLLILEDPMRDTYG